MKMRYFQMAHKFSAFGEHSLHRIGSVLVKGNRVISWGYNRDKTHTDSPHEFKSIHSEWDTIRKCTPEDVRGATIYVSRSKKDGTPALARPCSSCYSMLKDLGIRSICFTIEGSYAKEEL